jgi:hypothetical protein
MALRARGRRGILAAPAKRAREMAIGVAGQVSRCAFENIFDSLFSYRQMSIGNLVCIPAPCMAHRSSGRSGVKPHQQFESQKTVTFLYSISIIIEYKRPVAMRRDLANRRIAFVAGSCYRHLEEQ